MHLDDTWIGRAGTRGLSFSSIYLWVSGPRPTRSLATPKQKNGPSDDKARDRFMAAAQRQPTRPEGPPLVGRPRTRSVRVAEVPHGLAQSTQ